MRSREDVATWDMEMLSQTSWLSLTSVSLIIHLTAGIGDPWILQVSWRLCPSIPSTWPRVMDTCGGHANWYDDISVHSLWDTFSGWLHLAYPSYGDSNFWCTTTSRNFLRSQSHVHGLSFRVINWQNIDIYVQSKYILVWGFQQRNHNIRKTSRKA